MLPFFGIVVVFGAIIAGYLLESSNWHALIQPAELVIICGAAAGTMLTANPGPVLRATFRGAGRVFRGPPFTRDFYLTTLVMLFEIFDFSKRAGISRLDEDLDDPPRNGIFARYASKMPHRDTLDFICDSLRMVSFGAISPVDLDIALEADNEIREREMKLQVTSLEALADSLPGLGIAAAVLGVVLAMGSLGAAPKLIGLKVAAALVGTFIGILLSYGVVAPAAARLASNNRAAACYYQVLRAGLVAFAKRMPNIMAVEIARRSIPHDVRPDFEAVERACLAAAARRRKAA